MLRSKPIAAAAVAALILALPGPAAARLIIKSPNAHPRYQFEAEPHLLLGLWGVPGPGDGVGLGAGFRGSWVIVDDGFIGPLNDSVAIGFGIDWLHYEIDDWCGRYWRGSVYCGWDDEANIFWLPAVMQWNFWLTEKWSVFGEPGLALRINDEHYDDDVDLDLVFYAGGRFRFSQSVSLILRAGWPSALSAGLAF